MAESFQIPIAKGGKGAFIEVDPEDINNVDPAIFSMIVQEGLKALLNTRMGKQILAPTKLEGAEAEANKARALAQAEKNLTDLKAGKLVKREAAKTTGVDRATMTEAVRLAKEVVRNRIRAANMRPSMVPAKTQTEAAKRLVEADPSYLAKARENLAKVAETAKEDVLDLSDILREDPALVKKAEEEKAERAKNKPLSATQARKVAKHGTVKVPPARPQNAPHTSH